MSTTNEKYREDLTAYLLEVATGNILKESKHCVAAIWLNRLGYKFEKVNVVE